MSVRFDETPRGRKFFEADFPRLIKAIEENTAERKRANDLQEKALDLKKDFHNIIKGCGKHENEG